MAPAKETSCEAHLPAPVATEVLKLAALFDNLSVSGEPASRASNSEGGGESAEMEHGDGDRSKSESLNGSSASAHGLAVVRTQGYGRQNPAKGSASDAARDATNAISAFVQELSDGDLAYLVSKDPITSETLPPPSTIRTIPTPISLSAFNVEPSTPFEHALVAALRESRGREAALQRQLAELQSFKQLKSWMFCTAKNFEVSWRTRRVRRRKETDLESLWGMAQGWPAMFSFR